MAIDIHEQGNPEVSLPLNQVVLGDCVEVMAGWPENSVDTIVTDPPYGINFMGKEWDRALPPRGAFEQMIRVLKPGALAFVMSSPRQDVLWRVLSMLEGVGFELRQSFISWIYKTGFPKAFDVSKGIERKLRGDLIRLKVNYFTNKRGLSLKELAEKLDIPDAKKTLWDWLFDGHSPSNKNWLKVKEVLNVSDEEEEQFEREIIGSRDKLNSFKDGWGVGFSNYEEITLDITISKLNLAKEWEGWKSQTGLKPAAECILMVNKPRSERTIVDNVLRWGTGAINVDACRIPFQNEGDSQLVESKHDSVVGLSTPRANTYNWRKFEGVRTNGFTPKGRFPANLLISDGALDTGEVTKSGGHTPKRGDTGGLYQGGFGVINREEQHFNDEGSPFRFFDLDAWAEHHGFLDVAKPSKAERDLGLNTQPLQVPKSKFNLSDGSKDMRFDGVIPTPRRNIHPTCKPVKLMAYLIELGCPPKGIVVDPFVGSGTTCIAAKRLRRRWIGIEINPEYADIARARIDIKGPLDQYMEADG